MMVTYQPFMQRNHFAVCGTPPHAGSPLTSTGFPAAAFGVTAGASLSLPAHFSPPPAASMATAAAAAALSSPAAAAAGALQYCGNAVNLNMANMAALLNHPPPAHTSAAHHLASPVGISTGLSSPPPPSSAGATAASLVECSRPVPPLLLQCNAALLHEDHSVEVLDQPTSAGKLKELKTPSICTKKPVKIEDQEALEDSDKKKPKAAARNSFSIDSILAKPDRSAITRRSTSELSRKQQQNAQLVSSSIGTASSSAPISSRPSVPSLGALSVERTTAASSTSSPCSPPALSAAAANPSGAGGKPQSFYCFYPPPPPPPGPHAAHAAAVHAAAAAIFAAASPFPPHPAHHPHHPHHMLDAAAALGRVTAPVAVIGELARNAGQWKEGEGKEPLCPFHT